MASDKLEQLSQQLEAPKSVSNPPLHLWQPELSGTIDILIRRDGSWIHEGTPIRRPALVKLFASILRREEDGEYYLVTPVEKWRLQVECLPLLIVDFKLLDEGTAEQTLSVSTNTERDYRVSDQYPLFVLPPEEAAAGGVEEGVPAVRLDHGLAALFSRAAWYRLVDACEETAQGFGLRSSGSFYPVS